MATNRDNEELLSCGYGVFNSMINNGFYERINAVSFPLQMEKCMF